MFGSSRIRRLFPVRVRSTLRKVRDAIFVPLLAGRATRRLKRQKRNRPHSLPGELIVSLTSYPARFATLHLTLACLLDQTMRADRTILWLAHQDVAELPARVREFESRGLEIRVCEDIRSYKKLVPALLAYPDAFVATADDDIYYGPHWLEALIKGVRNEPRVISCHRAHRIKFAEDGAAQPYLDWDFDVRDEASRRPSVDLLPTGAGGILYPPNSFDPRVTERQLFERLSPDGDDLWFYWCARMAGTKHRKVGSKVWPINWKGTQESSLWQVNERGANDVSIGALQRKFGYLLPN